MHVMIIHVKCSIIITALSLTGSGSIIVPVCYLSFDNSHLIHNNHMKFGEISWPTTIHFFSQGVIVFTSVSLLDNITVHPISNVLLLFIPNVLLYTTIC